LYLVKNYVTKISRLGQLPLPNVSRGFLKFSSERSRRYPKPSGQGGGTLGNLLVNSRGISPSVKLQIFRHLSKVANAMLLGNLQEGSPNMYWQAFCNIPEE
jgi:hypothetical protein